MIKEEKPVNALQASAQLGVGQSYMSAIKRALGIRSRYFFLSQIRAFIRNNPDFTVARIYPRTRSPKAMANPSSQTMNQTAANHPTPPSPPIEPVPVEPAPPPANRRNQPTTQAASRRKLAGITAGAVWRSAVLGRKFTALTRHLPIKELAQLSGLSHETIRRLRLGELIKLGNFKQAVTKCGIDEAGWAELLVLYLAAQIGDDAKLLHLEVAAAKRRVGNEGGNSFLSESFAEFTAQEQETILLLLQHRDMIPMFDAILRRLPVRKIGRESACARQGESRAARPQRESKPRSQVLLAAAKRQDLWANL